MSELLFACCSGSRKDQKFPVKSWPVSIGRHARNTIALADEPSVSSYHCRVVNESEGFWVYDLKSANGTFVNGKRVNYRQQLLPNECVLSVGAVEFRFLDEARPAVEEEKVAAQLLQADAVLVPSVLPAGKSDEVVLVVDVAESTRMGGEQGDTFLVKNLWLLAEVFKAAARSRNVLFLKCTGDGFLATFTECEQALQVACEVLSYFLPGGPCGQGRSMPLRFALHRGRVIRSEDGDRFGLAVHLCVRLEGVKPAELQPPENQRLLPPVNRILLTDEARATLPSELQARATRLGSFTPRGFTAPVNIHVFV